MSTKKSILDSVIVGAPPSDQGERKAYNEAVMGFAINLALACSPALAEIYEKATGKKAPNWFDQKPNS